MANYQVVNADKLDADLTIVADAIREMTGTSAKMEFPDGFANTVKSIPNGPELPTLTSPGSASDLVKNKELIDQDGNVVTGTVKEVASGSTHTTTGADVAFFKATDYTDPFFRFTVKQVGDALLRAGSTISLSADPSKFGTATAADVAEGKTFTSARGLKLTGTYVCDGSDASAGLVVKSGSTTAQTFDTGLSSISYLVLFKKSNGATGLVEGFFSTDACAYVYCLSYSTTIKNFAIGADVSKYSFDGGTFNLSAIGVQGFSTDTTYYWYAFGTE